MADKTGIEWCESTWNPLRGCSRVSEGCRNCYAEGVANRFKGPGMPYEGLIAKGGQWNGQIMLVDEMLCQPIYWRRPRRIFVNSMSDLFHEGVPEWYIDRVFAVMALANQHTFQILTKRPERMRAYLQDFSFARMVGSCVNDEGISLIERCTTQNLEHAFGLKSGLSFARRDVWPLPNVWLGVSVEDQATADHRIPILLQTPAAVRWISAEPLLGPVDLQGWGPISAPAPTGSVAKLWAYYEWPDWIPSDLRLTIKKFWCESWGRGPHAWEADNHQQRMPATGALVGLCAEKNVVAIGNPSTTLTGRYVHCWNNIGRIVCEDGTVHFCSASTGQNWLSRWRVSGTDRYEHRLHWVVVGGESGPDARPIHPEWAQSLRDQCASAGVAFLFKQWGSWVPMMGHVQGVSVRGEKFIHPDGTIMGNAGKKSAGRLLDGVQHDGYPERKPTNEAA